MASAACSRFSMLYMYFHIYKLQCKQTQEKQGIKLKANRMNSLKYEGFVCN